MWTKGWRNKAWSGLDQRWDMVIVGGGIVGAGIMREAARLGLRVLLVEQRDFAWGTSSRSSKFVHGGLRYLKDLDFEMARYSIRERKRLLKDGRGLIEPINFLLVRYMGDKPGRLGYKLALMLYDLLAGSRNHDHYDIDSLRLLVPLLAEDGLIESFSSAEAQTDDARLTLRILSEGAAVGGCAINYVRAKTILREDGQVVGVQLHDLIENRESQVKARLVINATGAWTDQLREHVAGSDHMMRPLRGSHLIFPGWRLPMGQVVTINHPVDGRPISIFPWQGVTVVGSTDVDHHENLDDEPRITPDEVAYLMAVVEYAFSALNLRLEDVIATYAGVRPVIDTGKADPSKESRDHTIRYEGGLLTVTGGKLTTFQAMALDVLRAVPSDVCSIPAPKKHPALDPIHTELNLPEPLRSRLLGRYGNMVPEVAAAVKPEELKSIPGTPYVWGELRWAARREAVMHLDDLLLRRVRIGLLLPEGGKSLLPRIRAICQPEMGWDDERWEAEEVDYCSLWSRCYSLPDSSLIPDWHAMVHAARKQKNARNHPIRKG